jgi:hypothetical protein
MFILYALLVGLLVGLVAGGSPARLGTLRFRWGAVVMAGLLVQVALFSAAVTERIGDLGPPLYVASTALVLVAVAANWRIAGVPVIVAGAVANLAAILANGGYMPADPGALASIGHHIDTNYTNSAILAQPALRGLTDIFALPAWLPFTNVFSLGDAIICLGLIWVVVAAMRPGRPAPADALPAV